jgi:hypothetical protein
MAPEIVNNDGEITKPFAKKTSRKSNKEQTKETSPMTETISPTPEVAAPTTITNSPVSIADLYAEMESQLTLTSTTRNTGVTKKIRETIDAIFEATQKDKLLLSAVVHIVEQEEGRKKLYNIVRSVAQSKSGKYTLETLEGKAYIVLKV